MTVRPARHDQQDGRATARTVGERFSGRIVRRILGAHGFERVNTDATTGAIPDASAPHWG
ncbi:hypothetical protein [Haladaptatus paucihalophilus]|uniref:hypothetical protein n=1 Tax=Haladaptatus paucihalophilus TaxID=367189 RepID=UPI0015C523B4|nr:hypothetical protein [Haladaptatus paucihalophilus]